MDEAYLQLIRSDRVGRKTSAVLLDRLSSADEISSFLSPNLLCVLEAVIDRLIPDVDNPEQINIASLLMTKKSSGTGDGWRHAGMPPNDAAFALGLTCLDNTSRSHCSQSFASLIESEQVRLLKAVQRGQIDWSELDAALWFEGLLVDVIAIFVSHPATLAQLQFSGIAFMPRWETFGLDAKQGWEPGPK